jgi:hypothetical protein
MFRLATIVALALAAAILAAGCGSDSDDDGTATPQRDQTTQSQGRSTAPPGDSAPSGIRARECPGPGAVELRAVGVDCGAARAVHAAWDAREACSRPADASRFACSVRGYICLGTVAGRGLAVTCGRPGRSVSFISEPAT